MKKITTNRDNCPIHGVANLLADRWIFLILRELFLGYTKFDEFEKNLEISKSVLSKKLKHLLDNGVVQRNAYKEEKKRFRNEYKLTEKGQQLIFIMGSIMVYGNSNLVDSSQPFLKIVDKSGRPVQLSFLDENGEKISLKDLRLHI